MNISREMAWNTAWCSVLALWLLWGAVCSNAASGDGNAFPFDIEGSAVVGRQDPSETSDPRVTLGRLPPAAEVQYSVFATLLRTCVYHVYRLSHNPLFPHLFDKLDLHLD